MEYKPVYYSEYLELNRILDSQHPVSFQWKDKAAHDEMLFIIIHQAYELWFKQILFEVQSVIDMLNQPSVNDNSPELQKMVWRLNRVSTILNVLVHQVDIIETMTSMDFLDFRDMLRPASGFQSVQFKILEAKLGLEFKNRYGQEYYISQLKPADVEIIKKIEAEPTLLQLLNKWLERIPVFSSNTKWDSFPAPAEGKHHPFWQEYERIYTEGLAENEKQNIHAFKEVLFGEGNKGNRSFSPAASRAALFIFLYRGYPMLELPFQLLNTLVEIDNHMGTWRARHVNMVRRMIGNRTGTGGSTGAGYLQGAMEKHYIFRELTGLHSYLIERRKLPVLPKEIAQKLGYA